MLANHDLMVSRFERVMAKLAVLGQNPNRLVDCSEVIPVPKGRVGAAIFPAGKSFADVQVAVSIFFAKAFGYQLMAHGI